MLVLEQQAGLLENTLLARGIDVDQHVGDGQDGSETIHEAHPTVKRPGRSDRAMNYETLVPTLL